MQNANKTRGTAVLGGSGMVGLWGASSLVRSVQRGTFQNGTNTTGTTTITAVVPANAVLVNHGFTSNNSGSAQGGNLATWYGSVTNSTTISWARQYSAGLTTIVSWELLEFQPGVLKQVQFAETNTSINQTGTATITAVNTAKTFCLPTGQAAQNTTYYDDVTYTRIDLTNATTVTMTRTNASTGVVCIGRTCVLEFF